MWTHFVDNILNESKLIPSAQLNGYKYFYLTWIILFTTNHLFILIQMDIYIIYKFIGNFLFIWVRTNLFAHWFCYCFEYCYLALMILFYIDHLFADTEIVTIAIQPLLLHWTLFIHLCTVKWFQVFLCNTNNSIKEFQVLLFNTNYSIQHYSFILYTVKCFQVLLCITNNLIKHQSFVHAHLHYQTIQFLTI